MLHGGDGEHYVELIRGQVTTFDGAAMIFYIRVRAGITEILTDVYACDPGTGQRERQTVVARSAARNENRKSGEIFYDCFALVEELFSIAHRLRAGGNACPRLKPQPQHHINRPRRRTALQIVAQRAGDRRARGRRADVRRRVAEVRVIEDVAEIAVELQD